MEYLNCDSKCCLLQIHPYINKYKYNYKHKNSKRKAGVFIFDSKKNKILLIQSRGNLWGLPKGSLKYQETQENCAIREVKEETGIVISKKDFLKTILIRDRAIYYYIEKEECDVSVQKNIIDNDVNGIGWVDINCLEKLIINGKITLTQHSRIVFKKILDIDFPISRFNRF